MTLDSSGKDPDLLIITNQGNDYGMGHFNRMRLLSEYLKKMSICSEIAPGKDLPAGYQTNARVIVIDSRDDLFPENILNFKTNYQYYIAVDNRGKGRQQADIIWDTLPHPEMTSDELKRALRNCIIDPVFLKFSGQSIKSSQNMCQLADLEAGTIKCDLIQYPVRNNERKSPEEFQKKLIDANSVATYFGQTFFEALYLGKKIYLYDISDYHRDISNWFLKHIRDQPEIVTLLDGQGIHRLAVLIRSIVSGVFDLPVG